MCTRVLWPDSGQGILVARNMDWMLDMGTNLWVTPRGAERDGLPADPRPLRWTARHGSVVAAAYDAATTDGMNEHGLAAHILWLAESDFGDRDTTVPAVSASLWAQYLLDCCATVAEAVELMRRHPFQVRPAFDERSGKTSTVHLALDDADGDSAVIEYLDGTARVHHDRANTVMTNSPPYDEQLEHLRHYEGFGGDAPLPGTTEAADRFVRASYYLNHLPKPDNHDWALAALLSVARNAAQPFGTADPARPNISMTIWRTLADLTRRVYAFESSFRPDIVWTRLDDLDFTRPAKLDLSQPGLVGDVTGEYKPGPPLEFQV